MATPDRILVYQRPGRAWTVAIADYKERGLLLGRDVFTRRERCYKGTERCRAIWAESTRIANDYAQGGIPNELGQTADAA